MRKGFSNIWKSSVCKTKSKSKNFEADSASARTFGLSGMLSIIPSKNRVCWQKFKLCQLTKTKEDLANTLSQELLLE